jgi:ketosteroid isomerase-like protein
MAHPNADRIHRAYEAFSAGDMATLQAMWTDDVVWHIGGSNRITGDHAGAEAIFGFFGTLMEATGGTFRVELQGALADDDMAFSVHKSTAQRDGKEYELWETLGYRIVDGKFAEIWSFAFDQALSDELLA